VRQARASRKAIKRRCWRRTWEANSRAFNELLEHHAKATPDFFVLQIGAHDGVSGDPIHELIVKYDWQGLLVEPQPSLFEQLKANYSKLPHRLLFENAAVADSDGFRDMYFVRPEKVTREWETQIASFYPRESYSTEDIGAIRVPTVTIATLIKRHQVKKVDLLQVDVEGYDFEILKLVDFNRCPPSFIRYEHKHLTRRDRAASRRLLERQGYRVLPMENDTGAVSPQANARR
jgi:FkbM family methyltransferase